MGKLILKLYDYFKCHRGMMASMLVALTLLLGLLIMRVNYKEDITDFLPLSGDKQEAMRMFQETSGANRIIAIVGMKDGTKSDPDIIVEATDQFVSTISKEKIIPTYSVNLEQVGNISDFVYSNIPYFLTDADYQRFDSLLDNPNYISEQLSSDMEMLMFPSGGMLSENIGRDPLNLFTPTVEKLSGTTQSLNYELYDGHIFTPDMKNAVVLMESPYGNSETEQNGKLVERLSRYAQEVEGNYKNIQIKLTGGPVIAVGNSTQIKTDSILTVAFAVVLILALLFFSFRSWRNIALIAVTIAWGWLFALGCLSIVHDSISLIVIGISSIIIGIAVNYPLHLVAHLNHTPDMRQALKEIVEPLLVGNITTIGAFLALVPLKSIALRDLGLFASFLLIGTIFFVFAFLPHFVKVSAPKESKVFTRIGDIQLDKKKGLVIGTLVLTIVFAFFSLRTSFDPDISHINFMTDEQKADMSYLSGLLRNNPSEKTVYAVAKGNTLDQALEANEKMVNSIAGLDKKDGIKTVHSSTRFLVSKAEQSRRLSLWRKFIENYGKRIKAELAQTGAEYGFAIDSFNDFLAIINNSYTPKEASFFKPLTDGPFRNSIYYDRQNHHYAVLTPITVNSKDVEKAMTLIGSTINTQSNHKAQSSILNAQSVFEIGKLNSSIAESLSDNFNYIGWACSFIVFFFLWLSFGNIELAALSFLPMAVSWLWILGIMSLCGIKFNIINIILATFIFGQGDDYTIFMTEGCQYEYAYGRKMLSSYKNSIVISALIMFIGMGVLIFAKHPALRSLGSVTLVGMFSVVLMAYILPPFFFRWITSKGGKLRNRPLTIRSLLMPHRYPQECELGKSAESYIRYVRDAYYYCGKDIVSSVKGGLSLYNNFIDSENETTIVVQGGSYGAVALVVALANPQKTVIAKTTSEDDASVCRNVACRIANNIRIENE